MDESFGTMADGDGVSVHGGFPNPALERRERGGQLALDLNALLVNHPSSTYLFRIKGHNWTDQGVYDGDIAVIDRIAAQRPTDLVIIWQSGGFNLCRRRELRASDTAWGTVTAIIHQYR